MGSARWKPGSNQENMSEKWKELPFFITYYILQEFFVFFFLLLGMEDILLHRQNSISVVCHLNAQVEVTKLQKSRCAALQTSAI